MGLNVPAEILKFFDDKGIDILTDLFNTIYDTRIVPDDWLKSTFVTILKKHNPRSCTNYRTVCLNHALKVFLKIINGRIYRKCEERVSEHQFGFRNNLRTREALFCIQVLVQRSNDVNRDAYLCFVDYNKAFNNKERHEKLINILEDIGLGDKDV